MAAKTDIRVSDTVRFAWWPIRLTDRTFAWLRLVRVVTVFEVDAEKWVSSKDIPGVLIPFVARRDVFRF